MNDNLINPSITDLVKAMEVNLHAHLPLFSRMPRTTFWKEPGFLAVLTGLDASECCVYLAQVEPEEVERLIKQVLERFRSAGCLPMYWQVGPSTLPADMGKYLENCGFQPFARPPGMAAELKQVEQISRLPENFSIEPVRSEHQLREWVNILAKVDGLSDALRDGFYQLFAEMGLGPECDNQLFLGMENGKPVATSRLFCAGGVAGVWYVATLPERRGKGYGTFMTLAVCPAGRERDYRYGILYATPTGHGVYRRLGFQEYCHIDVYKSPDMGILEKQ